MTNLYYEYESYGPGKVITNLKLGLNFINEQFRSNPSFQEVDIEKDNFLILQNHPVFQNEEIVKRAIIGPNICVLPTENKTVMEQKYKKHLVPSKWVLDYFAKWIPEDKLQIWPVGINHHKFTPSNTPSFTPSTDCLIYFKRRSDVDLSKIIRILKKHNQSFEILGYGSYSENEFLQKLYASKYVILVNGTESQGIAVNEIMACDKPIFCWDVNKWADYGDKYIFPSTSVPYWDNCVGIKTDDESKLESLFEEFLSKLFTFSPRKYILDTLTLEKQASELLKLFQDVK